MSHLIETVPEGKLFRHRCTRCGLERVSEKPFVKGRCPATAEQGACVHLEPATGELIECPTCNGNVRIKVFGCRQRGECTLQQVVARPGEQPLDCCAVCNLRVVEVSLQSE